MRSQQVEPLDVGSPVEVESALVKDGPDSLERRLLEVPRAPRRVAPHGEHLSTPREDVTAVVLAVPRFNPRRAETRRHAQHAGANGRKRREPHDVAVRVEDAGPAVIERAGHDRRLLELEVRPDGQLAPPLALHPVAAECFVTGEARRVDDRVNLLFSRPVARDRVRAHVDFSRRVEAMQRPQEQLELPERRLRGQGRERVVAVRLFCGPAERVPARRRHDEGKGGPSQPHPETATCGGRFWGSRRTNRQRRRCPAPVRAAVLREIF